MPLISAHGRQSLWEGYYKVRVVELTELWGTLLTDLDIVNWDVMLVQMAKELIKFHTTTVDHECQKRTKTSCSSLPCKRIAKVSLFLSLTVSSNMLLA